MPEYKPLTQAEKDAILARHHQIVDQFNEVLGGVLQYEDDRILQKMEDPKEVAAYRLNQQNQVQEALRNQTLADLENKYGHSTIDPNPMARTIRFCLRTGDRPEDKAYNEKLYQEFLTDPNKIAYREYSKILKLNPKQLSDLCDDKQAIAEYYVQHTSLVESAFTFQSALEASTTSKGLREALPTLKMPVESLKEFSNLVKHSGVDGFACPTLTAEQTVIAMASPMFLNKANPELNDILNHSLSPLSNPKETFKKFTDYGLNIDDPDFLLKYKAVRTDPTTRERKNVSFDALFEQDDPNVRIETRSDEEIFQIRSINRAFQDRYAEKFQSLVADKLNQRIFDIGRLEDESKGNWVERKILKSTSPEWGEFIKAFKDFNDPKNPNYLRQDILKPKAEAYREHQRQQGYESLEDMKGTPLKRGTLTQAVIDVCDELEQQRPQISEDIDIKLNTGLDGKVGLIISEQEVNIFDDGVGLEENPFEKAFVLEEDEKLEADDGPVVSQ